MNSNLTGNFPATARLAGTTHQHVRRAMNGTNRLSFGMAVRIAKAAGVTVDELAAHVYGGDAEMQRQLREIEEKKRG